MTHPNAELARDLKHWSETGVDRNDVVADGKRKGYVVRVGDSWGLSEKGRMFVQKWTSRL